MFGASLALVLVVLGSSPSTEPSELVAQLGSPIYAKREAAEASLSLLGRAALPALRLARNSKDPEIQLRATNLLSRIEGALLVQSSEIKLDFHDLPMDEVIQSINRQTGLSLVLNPDDHASVQGRRVTLQSSEPMPFWKVLDALCESGQVHYIPGAQVPLGQKDGTLLLYAGKSDRKEPVFDSGPFRVLLSSVHYQSEIQLSQRPQPFGGRQRFVIANGEAKPAVPDASRQFFLQLLVIAEPRLSISQNGLAKVTVAVDDKGQSLLVPPSAGIFQHIAGYNGVNPSPIVRLRVDLARPEAAGQKIRLIRGTIPVTVATRKLEPLEVTIADAIGKVFRNDDVELSIIANRPAQNRGMGSLEIAVTQLGQTPQPIRIGEGEPLGYRPETPQQQIEILDANGKTLPWFPSGTFYRGEETRLSLTIVARGEPAVPAKIRYHGMIRASADVPFEFRNLPMP